MRNGSWLGILLICCGAGNAVDNGAPAAAFTEEAAARGLRFQHFNGGTGQYYLPESLGSGVALFDGDNDGDLDVYLLQGMALEPGKVGWRPKEASGSNRYFRNMLVEEGKLRFVHETAKSGLGGRGYAMGVAVGDYDNDGDIDVYVTGVGETILYRNEGGGVFKDVTREAGVSDSRVSTGAAFFDYDRDGDLDLLVLSYVDFTVAGNKRCLDGRGRLDYCQPSQYHPLPARLFRNEGKGRFRDVSEESGIGSAAGAGLGVVIADFNGDGWPDAYVANDGTPNHLWINNGKGGFAEVGLEAGAAYDEQGRTKAGMGVGAGDFDNDGDDDLIVANLMGEMLTLFENNGKAEFRDVTAHWKLSAASLPFTAFGANWIDYDNDGLLDLFVANGSVRILDQLSGDPFPYKQRSQLFRNTGRGFVEVRVPAMDEIAAARGAAFGDLDRDGDIDIVVSNSNGAARLYLNQTRNKGITVRPEKPGARLGLEREGLPTLWRN